MNELYNTDVEPAATNIKQKITKSWKQNFIPGTLDNEEKNLQRFTKDLGTWHFLIIIGIAVSGLAAFINTYDAISGINSAVKACSQTDVLKKDLNIQFIVLLVLSSFAVVFGLILAWFFRKKENQRRLLTLGIMTTGIFGILYALAIKFQDATNILKLFASWITFLGFLMLGWFLSTKKTIKVMAPIDLK